MEMTVLYGVSEQEWDSPIIECAFNLGQEFRVYAEGTNQNNTFNSSLDVIFPNYPGPGIHTFTATDGLRVDMWWSGSGHARQLPSSVCQVCVEPDQKSGLLRCADLGDETYPQHVLRAAFRCADQ
jgi:hypothetical protein